MTRETLTTKFVLLASHRFIAREAKVIQAGQFVQILFFCRDGATANAVEFFIDEAEPIDIKHCLSAAGFETI